MPRAITPEPIIEPLGTRDMLRLKAAVMEALREWMREKGFLETFYPEITEVTGSCETIANIFILEERELLPLRQTAQLFMEDLLIESGLPRMFTSGRSFRRERGGDGRHLSDFELFEFEALDIGLAKLVEYNREMVEHVIKRVLQSNLLDRNRQRILYHWLELWQTGDMGVMTYRGAIAYLASQNFTVSVNKESGTRPIEFGDDLTAEAEQMLTKKFGIVQVTHYPEAIKFFNMERSREERNAGCAEAVDLLLPYAGETIGGSSREYDYDILCSKLYASPMLEHLKTLNRRRGGSDREIVRAFDSYLALFRHGHFPRAGAGLGLGRLLQFLVASPEIIPF